MNLKRISALFVVIICIILLIVALQVAWFRTTYNHERKEFNSKIILLTEGICQELGICKVRKSSRVVQPIESTNKSTFLLKIDSIPNQLSLEQYVQMEKKKVNLLADCQLAVYDVKKQAYSYQFYLKSSSSVTASPNRTKLQTYQRDYTYLMIHFPNRDLYIFKRFDRWIISFGILAAALSTMFVFVVKYIRSRNSLQFQKTFVNSLVHEFKTPLSILKISAEELQESVPDKDKNRYISIINSEIDYLQTQTENLLVISQQDKKQALKKTTVSINHVVAEVVAKLLPIAERNKILVRTKYDNSEPTSKADSYLLFMAISNLLENAIKYHSKRPEIVIETEADELNCFIRVIDNGPGINHKEMPKIFSQFYRGKNSGYTPQKGNGLGLHVANYIIELHGGTLSATSIAGTGSVFTICLKKEKTL